MIDSKKIEQLARQIQESMPKGIREFGDDVEKRIRQTIQAQLTRLDVVNREEFDVQTQVLLRTREKLAALEQRLAVLESRSAVAAPAETSSAPLTATTSAPLSGTAAASQTPVTGSASAPVTPAPASPAPTLAKAAEPKDPA